MKKQISALLTALFITIMGMSTITEARTMGSATLSDRQKSLVTIAAFTANGDLDNLQAALNEGLEAGLTVNEIKEALVQLYAYCGFPRSLNGVNTFIAVMEERAAKGIQDEIGPEAKAMPANLDKNEYGMLVRQQLFGRTSEAPPSGYQLFTPVLDDFLKEHLFADIFYRDNLDYLSREIVTVAALASMNGTNPQLQSHMGAATNMGLTQGQMLDLIALIGARVGQAQGDNAAAVFESFLRSRAN